MITSHSFANNKAEPINKLHGVDWDKNEISSKFQGSWFLAKVPQSNGVPTLINIQDGDHIFNAGAGAHIGCVFTFIDPTTKKESKSVLAAYEDILIMEERPNPCITNVGTTNAMAFRYNPERQWKRGAGPYNSFTFWAPKLSTSGSSLWSSEIAESVFYPNHCTLEAAINQFKYGKDVMGRALSDKYWLMKSKGEEVLRLFRHNTFVGSLIGKKFFINEVAVILKEELKTELPHLKEKYAY